ncbi:hypothetical protein [Capillibacterium thermochitinicola]|uniref:Uncharacterized protein n=1 Tax=Capillibacterium thermochitinicola TaxID=2699427 RepID=A0A8J6I1S8_9FIRM|nr:hypothetical protein [Capillibacterium thermochitinicola]MBA2134155.1 hypothetical protein [Capillibacterium thermochitinicola]
MSDKKTDILYNHYIDTYANAKERENLRNKLFLITVGLLGLILLELTYSTDMVNAIKQINILGININISVIPLPILISFTWTFFSILSVRYYQVTIHIDKLYLYIHGLEKKLSALMGENNIISRESSGYLTKKFSIFRHCVWYYYTAIYPAIVIIVIIWSLILESSIAIIPIYHKYYDFCLGLLSVGFLVFYLVGQWLEK